MPGASDFLNSFHSSTPSEGTVRTLKPNDQSSEFSELPIDVLRRHLSTRSVVPTTSGFAERQNCARPCMCDLEVIGLGTCGSVFAVPKTEQAIKKGSDIDSLWNDFSLTNTVHSAFQNVMEILQVAFPENTIPRAPRCGSFHMPTSHFWRENLQRFPANHRRVEAAFTLDRIQPLPKPAREALIEMYFAGEDTEEAKNDEGNDACLVRVYLGEREAPDQSYDTLQNFPLRLDMIEDLGVEVEALADEMAIALAIIHFEAQVDGMDTEFVLGSASVTLASRQKGYETSPDEKPHEVEDLDFIRRPIHLWVLDFDKSKRIEMASDNIDHFVAAFLGNDPYFPRPDIDRDLWNRFQDTYTKASHTILKYRKASKPASNLPQLFLDAVEAKIEEHQDWDPEQCIVFSGCE
ncbi:MAG: hypothetical protein Q9219_001261 [cf. Caloplaca sp. 3 TL-2023]